MGYFVDASFFFPQMSSVRDISPTSFVHVGPTVTFTKKLLRLEDYKQKIPSLSIYLTMHEKLFYSNVLSTFSQRKNFG
jgi:hypothetical protein